MVKETQEEKALYTKSENGLKYVLHDSEEPLTHDQIGGMFGFHIAKRLLGIPFDYHWEKDALFYEYLPAVTPEQFPPYLKIKYPYDRVNCKSPLHKKTFQINIERYIKPLLASHQFIYHPEQLSFERTLNDIRQIIRFSDSENIGGQTCKLPQNLLEIQSDHLLNWWKKTFDSDYFAHPSGRPKNQIRKTQPIPLPMYKDKRKINIDFHTHVKWPDYENFVLILKSYIEDTALPYFEFYQTHERIAPHYLHPVLHAEYWLSLNQYEQAKYAIKNGLTKLNFPNHDESKYSHIINHFRERINIFFPEYSLEDLFQENIEFPDPKTFDLGDCTIDIELPSTLSVLLPEITVRPKKWWEFWK